jgi:oligopeptide/dipeptide ABC transporter ATP-binding protein
MTTPNREGFAMTDGKPLLEVKGLKKHFTIGRSILAKLLARQQDLLVRAVDGVDLNIQEGETLGLVGESGCGKSTLGRSILNIFPPTAGDVSFRGENVLAYNKNELLKFRRQAQIIFQNPYSSLNPRKTVRDIVAVPLVQQGIHNPVDREMRIRELLERVGLSEHHINNYPHQFSGGQRQRVGVARALAMQPSFIVCDEPVSALDVSVQAQIINLLEDLQQEFKLTYLFITHDLSVIYYVSNRIAVMYLGRIVEVASTKDLFEQPFHPYSRALLSAIPIVDKKARRKRIILEGSVPSPINIPPGCPFHPRCPEIIGEICSTRVPILREIDGGRMVMCHLYDT